MSRFAREPAPNWVTPSVPWHVTKTLGFITCVMNMKRSRRGTTAHGALVDDCRYACRGYVSVADSSFVWAGNEEGRG